MQHRLLRFHALALTRRHVWSEEVVALFLALFIFIAPASAAMRMQERSLYMNSSVPGATTFYNVSFRYMSLAAVGSVDMLFCEDPIPYMPCVTPPGLNVSGATLSSQNGETGYSISAQSANHIVLTRAPSIPATIGPSSYRFDNIVNPTDTSQAFAIRLKTHASTDATGPQIDFGSVRGQVTDGIEIETQVPPMLIFCAAEEVQENCGGTSENFYTDMGQLNSQKTLTAESQISIGTNASNGFALTVSGAPFSAGTSVIDSPAEPTASKVGSNQFGINLVANTTPAVGKDPGNEGANSVPAPDYNVPNRYKYASGDVIASSPSVTLMKRYTVSYILNSREDLKPGVYSTTINYLATGRF